MHASPLLCTCSLSFAKRKARCSFNTGEIEVKYEDGQIFYTCKSN